VTTRNAACPGLFPASTLNTCLATIFHRRPTTPRCRLSCFSDCVTYTRSAPVSVFIGLTTLLVRRISINYIHVRTRAGASVPQKPIKGKNRYSSSWEPHVRATGRHLPYGITQCYLPPNPSHAGWYSIYLPWRDGRLSWLSWLDSAPAGSRTNDLSITSARRQTAAPPETTVMLTPGVLSI